ncbi:MAG TPA: hypothetical protein VI759_02965 [Dehalococcoidia bacterium]|nr:hypothetical protein [Dehalococcoidia bacterium]
MATAQRNTRELAGPPRPSYLETERRSLTPYPAAADGLIPAACPNLGLPDDLFIHATFPSMEHRCYAGRPLRPSLDHQTRYCLGGGFGACAHNTGGGAEARDGSGILRLAGILFSGASVLVVVLAVLWLAGVSLSQLDLVASK